MGGSCSRKRDEAGNDSDEPSPEPGRLSISLRWPVKHFSLNHGEENGSSAGQYPTLLEMSIQVVCQVLSVDALFLRLLL